MKNLTMSFDLGSILNITSGMVVSDNGMQDIYDIIGFLSNDKGISTLGLLMYAKPAKEELLKQFPWAEKIVMPQIDPELSSEEIKRICHDFLVSLIPTYGDVHTVNQPVNGLSRSSEPVRQSTVTHNKPHF